MRPKPCAVAVQLLLARRPRSRGLRASCMKRWSSRPLPPTFCGHQLSSPGDLAAGSRDNLGECYAHLRRQIWQPYGSCEGDKLRVVAATADRLSPRMSFRRTLSFSIRKTPQAASSAIASKLVHIDDLQQSADLRA